MSRLFLLYLSRAAVGNVDFGVAAGVWGVTDDAVHRRVEALGGPTTGLEILRTAEVGDHVFAGFGGPQPRVARGGWEQAILTGGFLWRVTSPYFRDDTVIWPMPERKPGERWPHRFGIELVERLENVGQDKLGVAGMDALHYSANVGGIPIPLEVGPDVVGRPGALRPGESDDPAFLAIDGNLDATALIATRREQRKLRATLFAGRTTARCALCDDELPLNCVRTAHIKKRSVCSEQERRDLANIMPACTLGCDHLFELGFVLVTSDGVVTRGTTRSLTADLERAMNRVEGRACSVHSAASEPYFAWHRETMAG